MAVLQYHYRPILSFQPNAIPLLFFCSFTVHFLDVNPFCYAAEQRCAILRYMEWNYSSVDFFYLKSMFGFCLKIVCCLVFVLDKWLSRCFFFSSLGCQKTNSWKLPLFCVANMNAVILFPKKVPLLLQYFSLVYDYCICWKIIGYDEKCIVESLVKIFCKNEMTKFDILLLISIHTFLSWRTIWFFYKES